jgi:hypothetical protein
VDAENHLEAFQWYDGEIEYKLLPVNGVVDHLAHAHN